jgi:hypothetical protein
MITWPALRLFVQFVLPFGRFLVHTITLSSNTSTIIISYGIRAFDTSPYYGPSEILLGNTLKTLEPEFPRSSYQLVRTVFGLLFHTSNEIGLLCYT